MVMKKHWKTIKEKVTDVLAQGRRRGGGGDVEMENGHKSTFGLHSFRRRRLLQGGTYSASLSRNNMPTDESTFPNAELFE